MAEEDRRERRGGEVGLEPFERRRCQCTSDAAVERVEEAQVPALDVDAAVRERAAEDSRLQLDWKQVVVSAKVLGR